jgi:hypothetical protein
MLVRARIHASYLRFPRDLPTVGKLVVVSSRVRRFICAAMPNLSLARAVIRAGYRGQRPTLGQRHAAHRAATSAHGWAGCACAPALNPCCASFRRTR